MPTAAVGVADAKPPVKSDEPTLFDVNFVADCSDVIALEGRESALNAPYAETWSAARSFSCRARRSLGSIVINCDDRVASMFETPRRSGHVYLRQLWEALNDGSWQ